MREWWIFSSDQLCFFTEIGHIFFKSASYTCICTIQNIHEQPFGVITEVNLPSKYEKIAVIEAGSDFSFKDPSFDFTHQKKTDKALERLKNEAALLGANGIVIQSLSTQIKQTLHATDDGIASSNEKIKEIVS